MNRTRLTLAAALVVATAFGSTNTAHAADPPANDLFANATPITLDFVEVVDTTMATNTDAEDLEAKDACGSPPFGSPEPPDATVWYSLTLPDGDPQRVLISAAPPTFVTPGFNVVVDTPEGFACVGGGPVEVFFIAEPGVTYYIQSIDDQIPPGGPEEPLDEVNGGMLNFSATSLGVPLPDICPGIALDDPQLPQDANIIIGTDGDDHIRGTNGDDLIFGLDGDDEINGRGGNDVIFGCGGNDKINAGKGDDFVIGDSADFFGDPTNTNGGDDKINGGKGDDEIRGGPGDDDINGGAGMDEIFGNQGDDEIRGGPGDDFVVGGFGEDEVNGGPGDDGVFGGFDSDELNGGPGDDFVNGDAPAPPPFGVDESPHTDECNGGPGTNEIVFCEDIDGHDD
jgi:hypothetical protein